MNNEYKSPKAGAKAAALKRLRLELSGCTNWKTPATDDNIKRIKAPYKKPKYKSWLSFC